MEMWMIYDWEGLEKNKDYVAYFREICRPYSINVEAVLEADVTQRIAGGKTPAFVLVRTINPEINRFFEEREIPVFNSFHVSRICNDKGRTLQLLKDKVLSVPSVSFPNRELPRILTMDFGGIQRCFREKFIHSSFVEQESEVMEETTDFVVKAVDGHGGSQVFSLFHEREQIKEGIGGHNFVLQPMIKGGEISRDMRVYVIGRRIVAAVERSSSGNFRANFSLGGEVRLRELDQTQKKAVDTILREFDFGMAVIDFIIDEKERIFLNEIEDVVGARMLYRCAPHIDIAEQFVSYIVHEKLHIV